MPRPWRPGLLLIATALGLVGTTFLGVTEAWEARHGANVVALGASRPALVSDATQRRAHARVILVTLDGARWQDVFHQGRTLGPVPAMPRLLAATLKNGAARAITTSSSIPLSLPGYQALYAGRRTACDSNECPRSEEETLLDTLGPDAAVFASWAKLPLAFREGTGARVDAPPPGQGAPPWIDARFDAQTIAAALADFRVRRPRFLHLALLDMDQHGHAHDADGIVASLQQADRAIAALLEEIARLPEAERRLTTLIVSADHGRGPGALWRHHSRYAASRNIFAIAVGDLMGPEWRISTQAELRGTIEALLGAR